MSLLELIGGPSDGEIMPAWFAGERPPPILRVPHPYNALLLAEQGRTAIHIYARGERPRFGHAILYYHAGEEVIG